MERIPAEKSNASSQIPKNQRAGPTLRIRIDRTGRMGGVQFFHVVLLFSPLKARYVVGNGQIVQTADGWSGGILHVAVVENIGRPHLERECRLG